MTAPYRRLVRLKLVRERVESVPEEAPTRVALGVAGDGERVGLDEFAAGGALDRCRWPVPPGPGCDDRSADGGPAWVLQRDGRCEDVCKHANEHPASGHASRQRYCPIAGGNGIDQRDAFPESEGDVLEGGPRQSWRRPSRRM